MRDTAPMSKKGTSKRPSRRPGGYGEPGMGVNAKPTGVLGRQIVGDNSEEGFHPKTLPDGVHKSVNPDGGYAGNVVGPCSKPVKV